MSTWTIRKCNEDRVRTKFRIYLHCISGGILCEFLGNSFCVILELLFGQRPPCEIKAGERRRSPLCKIVLKILDIESINNAVRISQTNTNVATKPYLKARASSGVTQSITKIPALHSLRQRCQRSLAGEAACMIHTRPFWLPAKKALQGRVLLSLE